MARPDQTSARLFDSRSPAATEALGEALGQALFSGVVLSLDGDLGAGKTCFVRGLARGLGVTGQISSPSYTLMDAHEGRLPLYHLDAWMEGREKAFFLDGGDEWLHGEGVCAVEWGERVGDWLPLPRLAIRFEHRGPEERRIHLCLEGIETVEEDCAQRWRGILVHLEPKLLQQIEGGTELSSGPEAAEQG